MTTATSVPCPQCGRPTSTGLCAGVCPECLAASVLDAWEVPDEIEEPAAEDIITRVADYDVLRVLGRGGMGVVCRARDRLLGREVALKLIHSGVLASDEELRRFRLEAETVASLRHPHLIVVHEAGEADGQPYFTMTLAENGTLADRIHRLGRLPPHTAAELIKNIALAVHHAHARGVLHRDLKPANILFDSEDRPLVSDFGLARFTSKDSVTRSGSLLGTPAYLAPEVASGYAGHTTSSDVYALGVILYECLTGQPPFENTSPLALLKSITEDEIPSPSSLVKGLDYDLEAACLRSLAKEPGRRYASAEAMAADLDRWLSGEPVTARHPPLHERFWRWAQRNQSRAVLYSMAAVSVLFLVMLSAVWNVLLSIEKNDTKEAMYRSEVRRARLLRDYAVQLMGSTATLPRALPLLKEAASLTTGAAAEDVAVHPRLRAAQRLSPVRLQQWKASTPHPILSWSSDSKIAALKDADDARAFDLETRAPGDAARATLTHTSPASPMPVPDDENVPLRSLWSPDGRSVLVHSRGLVTLWTQPPPLPHWQAGPISDAWFGPDGRLLLHTGNAVLQFHPQDMSVEEVDAERPVADGSASPLSVTTDPTGLVHVWRGEAGGLEDCDPLPHPMAVTATALDPSNRYLATLTKDKTLRIWELATGGPVIPPVPAISSQAHLTWDASQSRLALWTDKEMVLYDW